MVPAPEIMFPCGASLTFHDGSWMVPDGSKWFRQWKIVILYRASLTFHDGSWMVPDGSDIGNSDSV